MANKTIFELDPIVTQSSTDISETSLNGSGSRKETRLQKDTYTKNFISSKQISSQTTSVTLTASQIVNAEIKLNPADAAQNFTFPTKALLYAAMGSPPVNSSVSCQIPNISNFISTLINSDFDITGMPTLIIPLKSTFDLNFVVTQITPSLSISVLGGFIDTSGAGNVVGPSSATNNSLVRFDSTTGKLIKNSIATLDDSGNLTTTSVITDFITAINNDLRINPHASSDTIFIGHDFSLSRIYIGESSTQTDFQVKDSDGTNFKVDIDGNTTVYNKFITNNNTKTVVFINGIDGVDSVGNGNYNNPFQNPSYAQSQITDASPTKQYVLFITGDITDTGQIYFSPNISFYAPSPITVTNSMTVLADPAWATAAAGSSTNWININFTNHVTLDFSAMTPTANPTGNFINVNLTSPKILTVNGWSSGNDPLTFFYFENCSALPILDNISYRGLNNDWLQGQIANSATQTSGTSVLSKNDNFNGGLSFNGGIETLSTRNVSIECIGSKSYQNNFFISQFYDSSVTAKFVGCDILVFFPETGGAGSCDIEVRGCNIDIMHVEGSATTTINIDSASLPSQPNFTTDGLATINIGNNLYNNNVPAPYLTSGTINPLDIINEIIVIDSSVITPISLDWGDAADIVAAFPVPLPNSTRNLIIINKGSSTVTLTNTTDPSNVGTTGLIGGNTKVQAAQTTLTYRIVVGNIITPSIGIFGG